MPKPKFYMHVNKASSAICLRYAYYHRTVKFFPGIVVDSTDWDKKAGRMKRGAVNATTVNVLLSRLEAEIERIVLDSFINGKIIEPRQLKDEMIAFMGRTPNAPSDTLLKFVSDQVKIREQSPNYAHNTIKKYRSFVNKIQRFDKFVLVSDVTPEWIEQFINWLTLNGMVANSVSKEVKVLKVFLAIAAEKGLIDQKVIRSRRSKVTETIASKRWLSFDELDKIYLAKLDKRLDNARQLFLLLCYTGQRYGDLSQLLNGKPVTVDGRQYFTVKQEKTGAVVHIPVHKVSAEIVAKKPKIISNQKLNEYIKELCAIAGIDDPDQMYTHTARRSAATNMYLSGISAKLICAITGHKTERMLLRYIQADSLDSAIAVGQRWQ